MPAQVLESTLVSTPYPSCEGPSSSQSDAQRPKSAQSTHGAR